MIQFFGMGILPVLVLLAGKMPAPQEILGYFFNWKSLINIFSISGLFFHNYQKINICLKTDVEKLEMIMGFNRI
jgi:hypothetical protein